MNEEPRLEWLRLYSEGHADAETTESLEREIRRDEEFRREVVEYLQLDAALAGAVAEIPPAKVVPFYRKVVVLAAVAACLAWVATLVWQWGTGEPSGQMVEVLEADCQPSLALGSQEFAGDVRIESGSIRFRMSSGAVVDVEAPARFSIQSATQLNLYQGNLTADAGGDTIGFVVETVSAHIVDLGTRFGVSVDDKGLTDVVVIEGKVEVFKDQTAANENRPLASLVEGEAVRVDRGRKAKRLKTVSLRRNSLMPNGKHRSRLLGEVSDNIDEVGFNRFYAIDKGAMGPGARLHTDRSGIRWQSVEGKGFPRFLEGADVVRTFYNDRKDRDHEIRLELKQHCTVFVFHETGKKVPSWLSEEFFRTNASLRSGPWRKGQERSEFFRTYDVWKKAADAGTVVLGPNHDSSKRAKAAMYGIAVKKARP